MIIYMVVKLIMRRTVQDLGFEVTNGPRGEVKPKKSRKKKIEGDWNIQAEVVQWF
jgi:hypothetical protein